MLNYEIQKEAQQSENMYTNNTRYFSKANFEKKSTRSTLFYFSKEYLFVSPSFVWFMKCSSGTEMISKFLESTVLQFETEQ